MNATTAPASPDHRDRQPRAASPRRRRTVIAGSILAAFLGAYVLGVAWFADTLNEDMARSFQVAPAVADVEHR